MLHSQDGVDEPTLAGKTVLVVEDEERLRTIVAMMIEELGAEVLSASDGLSAVEIFGGSHASIDLVLLDMRMAGLNGMATFDELVKIDPGVTVVFSSGVAPEEDVTDKIQAHRGGFIEKPFNLERLEEVLGKVLAGTATISIQ